MNKKITKPAAFVIGATILTAAVVPALSPEHAAAAVKWIYSKPAIVEVLNDSSNNLQTVSMEGEITSEVVVSDHEGNLQRLTIVDSKNEKSTAVAVDKDLAEKLQQTVDKGQQTWPLDPVEVVRNNAAKYGFNAEKDRFTLISQINKQPGGGNSMVLVEHDTKYYLVELIQPKGAGEKGIWQVISIKEVAVIAKPDEKKPDVGPGVEGLDYDKVVKWQQNVDEGKELWRLDPMQVAKNEGKYYGFTEKDTFTIVRKLNSSTIARHGQIDIEVNHQGKVYTMIIVKPFGGRDAIWTTYKVVGKVNSPEKPVENKLFETNNYLDWKWYKSQYPQDMLLAALINYDGQLYNDSRISDNMRSKFEGSEFKDKLILFAYLGASSAKSDIGIEKVTMAGSNMMVHVHTRSPRPDEMITMNITYPDDYITLDRSIVDKWGSITITFVDQNGKVLSKNKLTIR